MISFFLLAAPTLWILRLPNGLWFIWNKTWYAFDAVLATMQVKSIVIYMLLYWLGVALS